ncbi:MAG: hypothetical protein FD145_903 [Candidatus Saganbacteria bacterium]|uniref:SpoVG family protein n=1 Tax=Candidatus Saganbacteria bacterium TaxID=2575572 RepID=A0A833L0U8_UNCSA|nr:MAG: hypothetical protein FD145_903 [Candidatus Saganbacteria bacterium]
MSESIEISEVQIKFIPPHDGLVGFCSCVINDQLKIANIAIYNRINGGFRLVFPTKKLKNGQNIPCLHPINEESGKAIEDAIFKKFTELCDEGSDLSWAKN